MAIDLAGSFYEMKRTDTFRSKNSKTAAKRLFVDPETDLPVEKTVIVGFFDAYPNAHAFAMAHWPYFYDAARRTLTTMLGLPQVSEFKKQAILKALIEDREKQVEEEYRLSMKGKSLPDLIGQVGAVEPATKDNSPRTLPT
jgi:hypothetical protein